VENTKSFLENKSKELQLYPASYSQASMFFIYKMAPEAVGYNVMFATRVKSQVNFVGLETAVRNLVHKHTTLRTTFFEAGAKVYQRLISENFYHFQQFDISSLTDDELQAKMEDFGHIPYDLHKGPLFRLGIFSRSSNEHFIVIGMHHITCDAGSFETIFKDLQHFYDCALKGIEPYYAPISAFNKFVQWERKWLNSEPATKAKAYWTRQLQTPPSRINLKKLAKAGDTLDDFAPTRTNNFNFDGGEYFYNFDQNFTNNLKVLAKREKVTLYNILVSVYFILLHKLTNETDVTVGSYANLRHHHEFENQVGYYLNTIVLRANIFPEMSFKDYLQKTRDNSLEALSHQYYPFVLLAEELKPERETGRQLWFDHILNWTTGDNYEMSNSYFMDIETTGEQKTQPLPMQPWKIKRRTAPFDMALNMGEINNQIACSIFYNSSLFDEESVATLMHRYKTLLKQIIDYPESTISQLSLLDKHEHNIILKKWNENASEYNRKSTLHESFIKQAEANPDAIAIISGDESLTYAQLNEYSKQVAETLKRLGVKAGMSIGICIERSPKLIVGLFAILRIGAHYVPLDPTYPTERNDYMLQDSEAVLLLTTSEVRESYTPSVVNSIIINPDYTAMCLNETAVEIPQNIKELDTAYLIYTSGSTGQPKGTKVSHRNCAALFHWADQTFLSNEIKTVLASTSICFDISVFEIFYPLTRGAKIILIQDLLHLPEDKNKDNISLINTVPSVISALLEYDSLPKNVEVITLVGEPLRRSLVNKLYSHASVKKVYNLYGPTEDTVFSTSLLVSQNETKEPSIGRAISNTTTYILDKDLNLVPPYIPGELYLGGDGVTLGYHNREELNKERFMDDLFRPGKGRKLYKTGDTTYYLPNGEIEFIGRSDNQVKIRGYRIELGEIEHALNQLDNISEAVVSAITLEGRPEKELVTYVVSDLAKFNAEGCMIDKFLQKKFTEKLENSLPLHLIPSHFVFVKEMPKTLNGKIDRKELARVFDLTRSHSKESSNSQMTNTQKIIAEIWGEVLGIDPNSIGVYDKFYNLGGSSLRLGQIVKHIQEKLNRKISIADLFRFQDIYAIAQWLEEGDGNSEVIKAGFTQGSIRRSRLQDLARRKQAVGTLND